MVPDFKAIPKNQPLFFQLSTFPGLEGIDFIRASVKTMLAKQHGQSPSNLFIVRSAASENSGQVGAHPPRRIGAKWLKSVDSSRQP